MGIDEEMLAQALMYLYAFRENEAKSWARALLQALKGSPQSRVVAQKEIDQLISEYARWMGFDEEDTNDE